MRDPQTERSFPHPLAVLIPTACRNLSTANVQVMPDMAVVSCAVIRGLTPSLVARLGGER